MCLGSACGHGVWMVSGEVPTRVGWALPAWAYPAVGGDVCLYCCLASEAFGVGVGAAGPLGPGGAGCYRCSAGLAAGAWPCGECVTCGMEG